MFFSGDLRQVLYVIPFSFMGWIYRNLHYYIIYFYDRTMAYVNNIVIKRYIGVEPLYQIANRGILVKPDLIQLTLTEFGPSEGFTNNDLEFIKTIWIRYRFIYQEIISNTLSLYLANQFLLFSRLILFFYALYFYMCVNMDDTHKLMVLFGTKMSNLVGQKNSQSIMLVQQRTKVTAWTIPKQHQLDVIRDTNGSYYPNHLALCEDSIIDEHSNPLFLGHATHGTGGADLGFLRCILH